MSSEFYRQHYDVEAPQIDAAHFRPAWRVYTQLDRLLTQGTIARPEHACAVALRRDLELVLAAAYPAPPELGVPSARRPSPLPPIRFDALIRLHKLRTALGTIVYELLRIILIDDPSWAALGLRLRVDPRTARSWAVEAIKLLAAIKTA